MTTKSHFSEICQCTVCPLCRGPACLERRRACHWSQMQRISKCVESAVCPRV